MKNATTVKAPVNAMSFVTSQAIAAGKETKAANKEAAAKTVKRATRTAPADVAKANAAKSIIAASVATLPVKFMIANRPAGGQLVKAYSQAWLELTGFINGKELPSKVIKAIAGQRALTYHMERGSFEPTGAGMIKLTPFGKEFFEIRTEKNEYVREDVDGYKAILKGGKVDNRLVKNKSMIIPFAI